MATVQYIVTLRWLSGVVLLLIHLLSLPASMAALRHRRLICPPSMDRMKKGIKVHPCLYQNRVRVQQTQRFMVVQEVMRRGLMTVRFQR